MDFNAACGIADPKNMPYEERIGRYVDLIGFDALRAFLPYSKEELQDYYAKDQDFNNTKLKDWDQAAGFRLSASLRGVPVYRCTGPFYDLLWSKGVTDFTLSDCVSILKHVARRLVTGEKDGCPDNGTEKPAGGTEKPAGTGAPVTARTDPDRKYDYFTIDRFSDGKKFFVKTERDDTRTFSRTEMTYMLRLLYPELKDATPEAFGGVTRISVQEAIITYDAQKYDAPVYGHYGTFYQRPGR